MSIDESPLNRRAYLGVLGLAALAGCTSDTDDEDDSGDTSDGGDSAADGSGGNDTGTGNQGDDGGESEPVEVDAAIGDLVEGDNLQLVVESIERTTQVGEFQEADEGNEFLLIQIALKNISDGFLSVSNLLQTRVRDDEDYSYDQTVAVTEDPTFNDGQFAPGELERGIISFEIPEDASGLVLSFDFDVSIFGGVDRAEIDLETENEVHELTQELAAEIHSLGNEVSHSDVTVAAREVRFEDELGQFAQPDEGNEYVIVDISVTNNTGEEQRISTALQMMCKSDDGWTHQEDLSATTELDRPFDEGSALADGETRAGEVAYELEAGLSPLYWVFEFDLWTDGNKTFWELR